MAAAFATTVGRYSGKVAATRFFTSDWLPIGVRSPSSFHPMATQFPCSNSPNRRPPSPALTIQNRDIHYPPIPNRRRFFALCKKNSASRGKNKPQFTSLRKAHSDQPLEPPPSEGKTHIADQEKIILPSLTEGQIEEVEAIRVAIAAVGDRVVQYSRPLVPVTSIHSCGLSLVTLTSPPPQSPRQTDVPPAGHSDQPWSRPVTLTRCRCPATPAPRCGSVEPVTPTVSDVLFHCRHRPTSHTTAVRLQSVRCRPSRRSRVVRRAVPLAYQPVAPRTKVANYRRSRTPPRRSETANCTRMSTGMLF